MANDARPPSKAGPIVEALFLDVPYIIDSMWRGVEYRANRVGSVELEGNVHSWRARSLARTAVFAGYALITLFIAFGPTFDSLCGILGASGIRDLAKLMSALCIAGAGLIALAMIAAILPTLTRRLRDQQSNFNAVPRKMSPWMGEVIQAVTNMLSRTLTHGILTQHNIDVISKVLPDLFAEASKLNARGWKRLISATLALLIFAIGCTVAPFVAAYVAFDNWNADARVCRQVQDSAAVWWQLAVTAVMVAVGAWVLATKRLNSAAIRLALILATWLAGVAVLWGVVAGPLAREADPGPYPQIYPIVVGLLMLVALLARWWANFLLDHVARIARAGSADWYMRFRQRMTTTELLGIDRADPDIGIYRILASFVNGVGSRPLQALLMPAFVAMMFPSRGLLTATVVAFACGAMLLAYGSLSTRWQQLVTYVERWFLVGLPLPISVFVIVIGALRLMDVQYVATILDAAPFGVLLTGVVMCYLAAWFFEYWINRWPAEHLLAALGAPDSGREGVLRISSRLADRPVGVQPSGRVLAVHSPGRLCAQGWQQNRGSSVWEPEREVVFVTYGFLDLFHALSLPGDDANILHSLQRGLRVYFYTINVVLMVIGGALLWLHFNYAAPLVSQPVIEARVDPAQPRPDDFIALLERQAVESRPAIIVAASGGGTRAALYTARALEGLAGLDRTRDVVLVSGVSGGGVAGALFVARYDVLGGAKRDHEAAWAKYVQDVAQPFIADVLDGSGELRVARDVALGQLLAESFTRRLFEDSVVTLGDLRGPKLILNTTVSGHPAEDSRLLDGRAAVVMKGDDCLEYSRPFASLAGSRLIFTTLASDAGFPGDAAASGNAVELADVRLSYTVVRASSVPVAAAAALNANFPPVFPNARVSLINAHWPGCDRRSYFVTDGGATENLGLVSALYALRGALRNWPAGAKLPVVHLVAAEASAVSYDYEQDRGISAATGGSKERVTGALTQELVDSVNDLLRAHKAEPLHIHFLPLPVAFRSRGGFGTHWMSADTFRVSNPLLREMPGRFMSSLKQAFTSQQYYQTLHRDDIDKLWPALFSPRGGFCRSPHAYSGDAARVGEWICGTDMARELQVSPDAQIAAWDAVVAELGQ